MATPFSCLGAGRAGNHRYSSLDGNLDKKASVLRNRRTRMVAFLALLLLAFFSFSFAVRSSKGQEIATTIGTTISTTIDHIKAPIQPSKPTSDNHGYFHLLIPADKSDVNLCKAILSATLLGYPIPTLYNWAGASSKMAKITGALEYFKALDATHDEDLVLIVDGFDLWFQLSPQIMIDRYQAINARAEERIRARMGDSMQKDNVTQTIVFSSQKRCWPGEDDDLSCYAVPESPLPRFVYGPQTDVLTTDEKNLYLRMRQRWLNAGFVIGPIKEMRALFERAEERAEADPDQKGHDQNVLSTIWGEQEHQREAARTGQSAPWKREEEEESLPKTPSYKDFKPAPNTNYEFGIGLDYESSLSMPTVFSEYDSAWICFSNDSTLEVAVAEYGIINPRANELQADIAQSEAPFSIIGAGDGQDAGEEVSPTSPQSTGWKDVLVYTNLWTGISPAIIHHNAHRDGLKALRETVWDRMWFQPLARKLLDARMAAPYSPIAVDSTGKKWYSSVDQTTIQEKGYGAQTDNKELGGWSKWSNLCSAEDQNEVFRDGKGPWEQKASIGEESAGQGSRQAGIEG